MNPPAAQQSKTYFIRRGETEVGPFTIAQLNKMHSRSEITATDLCRSADSSDFHPLVAMFPHMANFARKSREEHIREARTTEGNSQANAALICGVLAWFIAAPVLGVFGIVLGIKSWVRVQRIQGLAGAVVGGLAVAAWVLHFLKSFH